MTIAPDGFQRVALGVNNSIPGPTIEANWVSTHNLADNHISDNRHGFRQNHTVQQDGVPSIIQCPDAVGTS